MKINTCISAGNWLWGGLGSVPASGWDWEQPGGPQAKVGQTTLSLRALQGPPGTLLRGGLGDTGCFSQSWQEIMMPGWSCCKGDGEIGEAAVFSHIERGEDLSWPWKKIDICWLLLSLEKKRNRSVCEREADKKLDPAAWKARWGWEDIAAAPCKAALHPVIEGDCHPLVSPQLTMAVGCGDLQGFLAALQSSNSSAVQVGAAQDLRLLHQGTHAKR